MEHALTGIGALVHDEAVSAGREAELFGHVPRGEDELAEQLGVLRRRLVHAGDVALWDDEYMYGSHGPNVFEREHVAFVENDLRGCLTAGDVAEEAARHTSERSTRPSRVVQKSARP
jgi:hypothetical protein